MLHRRLYSISVLLLVLCVPLSTLAQTMKSTNYQFDDVNFGSVFNLVTNTSETVPTISSEGPVITLLAATKVTIEWKTVDTATSFVEYGTTTNYGTQTGGTDLVRDHSVTILGLTPQTEYHYRVLSTNSQGGTAKSEDKTFTTPALTEFREISISRVGYTDAVVSVVTGGLTKLSLDYGPTQSFGFTKSVATGTSTNEYSFSITDLIPGTKYYVRLRGIDTKGNEILSSTLTFTTIAQPILTKFTAEGISSNQIEVIVNTNTETTLILTYQSEKDPKPLSAGDTTLTTNHDIRLSSLFGNTEYSIKAEATDKGGRRVTGNIKASTKVDVTPPEMTDPNLSITHSGRVITVTARWKTNEPVKSSAVATSKTHSNDVVKTTLDSYTIEPVLVLTGFTPGTPYVMDVSSVDSAGNKTTKSITFITPRATKSIIELILSILSKIIAPFAKLLDYINRRHNG